MRSSVRPCGRHRRPRARQRPAVRGEPIARRSRPLRRRRRSMLFDPPLRRPASTSMARSTDLAEHPGRQLRAEFVGDRSSRAGRALAAVTFDEVIGPCSSSSPTGRQMAAIHRRGSGTSCSMATGHVRRPRADYRLPGSSEIITQTLTLAYPNDPAEIPSETYLSAPDGGTAMPRSFRDAELPAPLPRWNGLERDARRSRHHR